MKRLLAGGAVALVAIAVAVGTAIGQGTGGTLGAGAVGSKTFEVRIKSNQFGINCGNYTQRECFRRPRLASVGAGNGTIYVAGKKVGTAIFGNITGKRLGKEDSLDLFFATGVFDDGSTLSFQGADSEAKQFESLPYSLTGGTGTYAGARGTVVDSEAPGGSNSEFRVNLSVTFIP